MKNMDTFTEAIFDVVHDDIVWNEGSQCCECDVRFEKGTLKDEFLKVLPKVINKKPKEL